MTQHRLTLAVHRNRLPKRLAMTGFYPMSSKDLLQTLEEAGLWLGPRILLEEDDAFIQLIPYIVLVQDDLVIQYRRATSGSEPRLHGRISIGVGGHVDLGDVEVNQGTLGLEGSLLSAAYREIDEELGDDKIVGTDWIGLIMDNDSAVGRVHLGIVGVWPENIQLGGFIEDDLQEVRRVPIADLQADDPSLETWSALLVPYLQGLKRDPRNKIQ